MIFDYLAGVAFFFFVAGVFVGLGVSLYDRAERRQAVIDVLIHAARCETAASHCTRKEAKAYDYAEAARQAAKDAERFMRSMEGLHDCLKPPLPILSPEQARCLIDMGSHVDMDLPTIDPQGRTGEMEQLPHKTKEAT